MDPGEKNRLALKAYVDIMKNLLDQFVKAMIVLSKREDNVQYIAVTENVISPQINNHDQPQPVRIPVENSNVQERHIVQDVYSSSHDITEYHSLAFFAPNSQGVVPVVNIERP